VQERWADGDGEEGHNEAAESDGAAAMVIGTSTSSKIGVKHTRKHLKITTTLSVRNA
jgi:hypothetical protein